MEGLFNERTNIFKEFESQVEDSQMENVILSPLGHTRTLEELELTIKNLNQCLISKGEQAIPSSLLSSLPLVDTDSLIQLILNNLNTLESKKHELNESARIRSEERLIQERKIERMTQTLEDKNSKLNRIDQTLKRREEELDKALKHGNTEREEFTKEINMLRRNNNQHLHNLSRKEGEVESLKAKLVTVRGKDPTQYVNGNVQIQEIKLNWNNIYAENGRNELENLINMQSAATFHKISQENQDLRHSLLSFQKEMFDIIQIQTHNFETDYEKQFGQEFNDQTGIFQNNIDDIPDKNGLRPLEDTSIDIISTFEQNLKIIRNTFEQIRDHKIVHGIGVNKEKIDSKAIQQLKDICTNCNAELEVQTISKYLESEKDNSDSNIIPSSKAFKYSKINQMMIDQLVEHMDNYTEIININELNLASLHEINEDPEGQVQEIRGIRMNRGQAVQEEDYENNLSVTLN